MRYGAYSTGARRLLVWGMLVFVCAAASIVGTPLRAYAEGPNAVLTPPGYDANTVPRGDDNTVQVVNLPFAMNWGGTTYTQIYINQNGIVTYGSSYTAYTPSTALNRLRRDAMAVFWADVDTRSGGQSTYSDTANPPLVNGRPAFFVNWIDVGYYSNQNGTPNSFQLVLVDRSDTGAGNFDFMYNYDKVQWDVGQASGNQKARVGWARANRTGDELPGSGTTGASTLLDTSNSATSLIQNTMSPDNQLGRYVWQVRNGQSPNQPPVITVTDRTLEANAAGGYTGYTGAGDASATDPDGTVSSLTHNRPAFLPLGTTNVTWTATDNRGAVTTANQSILVQDTTPPSNPTVTSSTHTAGAWSTVGSVTVNWSGAADVVSGVAGYSYSWSQNAAALPDTTSDTTGATLTAAQADGIWYFNIRAVDGSGNWAPAAASIGPFRIDRVAPTTTTNAPTGWRTANVNVTLSATDPAPGVVAGTSYRINGGAIQAYTVPFLVSTEGTTSIAYWSTDAAGNAETAKTSQVRIDKTAPSVPAFVGSSALSTSSVEATWSASTDTVSGVAYYRVYRDGSMVGTTSARAYVDSGLVAGQTYAYSVAAVDVAGNASAQSPASTITVPQAQIWMSIAGGPLDLGSLEPGNVSTFPSAITVTVGGLGSLGYQLTCSGTDFVNSDAGASTPTMPIGQLGFVTSGWASYGIRQFSSAGVAVHDSVGGVSTWSHPYVFDLSLDVPWDYDAGTYTTTITYTVVEN